MKSLEWGESGSGKTRDTLKSFYFFVQRIAPLIFLMPLQQDVKQQVINEYQVHGTDTGSTEVQIAMLTARVKQLSEHLKTNKKDHSSRRGLLKVIGRRKRLMAYLQSQDRTKYQELIQKLGIRG